MAVLQVLFIILMILELCVVESGNENEGNEANGPHPEELSVVTGNRMIIPYSTVKIIGIILIGFIVMNVIIMLRLLCLSKDKKLNNVKIHQIDSDNENDVMIKS